MTPQYTVILPTGAAKLENLCRTWDESPQQVFSVELINHPILYGIWRPVFEPNGDDFKVEIIGFGWESRYNVGNPIPETRTPLSKCQERDVKNLIITLLNDVDARRRIGLFSSKRAHFLGEIDFSFNWAPFE